MPKCHFSNGWCLVGACFLGLLHSSSSSSVPCCHLLPSALFTNPPWWLTSVKLQMESWCSLVYQTFLTNQDRPYTSATEIAWNMQISTNDNSINGPQSLLLATNVVISILSLLLNACQFVFLWKIFFVRNFRFSFPQWIPGSCEYNVLWPPDNFKGLHWGAKTRFMYLNLTNCSFLLLFAPIYKDPNQVQVICNKSLHRFTKKSHDCSSAL